MSFYFLTSNAAQARTFQEMGGARICLQEGGSLPEISKPLVIDSRSIPIKALAQTLLECRRKKITTIVLAQPGGKRLTVAHIADVLAIISYENFPILTGFLNLLPGLQHTGHRPICVGVKPPLHKPSQLHLLVLVAMLESSNEDTYVTLARKALTSRAHIHRIRAELEKLFDYHPTAKQHASQKAREMLEHVSRSRPYFMATGVAKRRRYSWR
jgi:hypothetical protein